MTERLVTDSWGSVRSLYFPTKSAPAPDFVPISLRNRLPSPISARRGMTLFHRVQGDRPSICPDKISSRPRFSSWLTCLGLLFRR